MKRCCAMLCFLGMFLAVLCGCSGQSDQAEILRPYEVVLRAPNGETAESTWRIEDLFGDPSVNTRFTAEEVDKEITVTVDGREIRCAYDYSQIAEPNCFPTHVYKGAEGEKIGLDPEGMLLNYSYSGAKGQSTAEVLTEEKCVSVAREFVNGYCNVNSYETTVAKDDDKYEIHFEKWIDGVRTTEFARVIIKETGEITKYTAYMLGKLPDSVPYAFDMVRVEKELHKKLNAYYENMGKELSNISYRDINVSYTVLKTGELALYGSVSVTHTSDLGNGNRGETSERLIWVAGL